MPSDNAGVIGAGEPIAFPRAGPTSSNGITAGPSNTFVLAAIGIYMVTYQVSVTGSAQLVLYLNGAIQPQTVTGRSAANSQINSTVLITVTTANSSLSVVNPAINATELTITPDAGGTLAVSAQLTITRYV
jgi:hypothetical protein